MKRTSEHNTTEDTAAGTSRLQRLHGDEQGAVLILMLAGIIISLMTALVLYEAGHASRDKVDAQMAADASAYSASAVKARSMNMIAFANTGKRMVYGMSTVYINAYLSLIASQLAYAGQCGMFNVGACLKAIQGGIQVAMESIEFIFNMRNIITVSRAEVQSMETYQDYLINITPWWAWMDATIRSRVNHTSFAMTWPPPGDVSEIFDTVTQLVQAIDLIAGTGMGSSIPDHSDMNDELPLKRRDKDTIGSDIPGLGGFLGPLVANSSYCSQFIFSPEHMLLAFHYWKKSSGIADDAQTLGFYALKSLASAVPLVNMADPACLVAYATLGE